MFVSLDTTNASPKPTLNITIPIAAVPGLEITDMTYSGHYFELSSFNDLDV